MNLMKKQSVIYPLLVLLILPAAAHDIPFEHSHNGDGTYTVQANGNVVSDVDVTARLWNPRGKSSEEIEARVKFLAKSFDPYRSPEEVAKDNVFRQRFQDAVVINSLFPSAAKLVGVKDEQFIAGAHRNARAGVTLAMATVMAFTGSADTEDPRVPAAATDKVLKDSGYAKISTTSEIREAAGAGRLVFIYNTQDSGQLTGIPIEQIDKNDPLANVSAEEKTAALKTLEEGMNWAQAAGIKAMNFAYNETNALGGGGNQAHNGVTLLGEAFIKMANARGIVVDCSHSSDKVCIEMAELSARPVMASHSNVKALLDVNRNMSDEAILAVGRTGGVVCTNGVGIFLSEDGSADPAVFAEHVVHTAELIGKSGTCYASDYLHNWEDFARRYVPAVDTYAPEQGLAAPTENITVEQIWAVARILHEDYAWSEDDIRGFLGENLMRVYEANW
jgi:membrane dipeptidase